MSRESFIARIERELPAGTVIINPKWWADRLWKWSQQAATKAVKPKWIPYKEGDVVAKGRYEVTASNDRVDIDFFDGEMWRCFEDTVTAYRPLPAPYGGE